MAGRGQRRSQIAGARSSSSCALVRSQVAALRESPPSASATPCSADAYLRLAIDLAAGSDPRLLITHGLPGSGKTYLSQGLLESAGAVRVRSDVERKRLFGLGALESSRDGPGPALYDASATQATYARLLAAARASLEGAGRRSSTRPQAQRAHGARRARGRVVVAVHHSRLPRFAAAAALQDRSPTAARRRRFRGGRRGAGSISAGGKALPGVPGGSRRTFRRRS
jgi:predicted kinase